MKNHLLMLWLCLCCLFSTTAFAQTVTVTQRQALAVAKEKFKNQDVDYFLLTDNLVSAPGTIGTVWKIFVDAEPLKGWEHQCYVVEVPKFSTTSDVTAIPYTLKSYKLPPAGDYSPLSVKKRYETNGNFKPSVKKAVLSTAEKTVAEKTYAIILSGGVQPVSNNERYWNDCSFIYQTLVNKYGIPKSHIYPIMSDGDNTGLDMLTVSGTLVSQSLDLDFDGESDISLAATKANVTQTLKSLENKLQKDDHLFIYVIDHGGSTTNHANSYICLWNNENLYDYELANMLTPFSTKKVNVNVVLGQCHSGGFIDDLTKTGCVVATACKNSEFSYGCTDKPYDEFVYEWTSAINGADHRGNTVNADTDGNNKVTMEEAFAYAKANDWMVETPQYVSTPISVGEDLAFNYLPPAVDLYLKDNPEDTGKEPNLTTDKYWMSPSIWVRNQADGKYEHENPIYSLSHMGAIVYVRIYNRGKEDYISTPNTRKYLHLYWAQASTGITPDVWMGKVTNPDGFVTGGKVNDPVNLSITIPAGEYRDVPVPWALPQYLLGTANDNETEKHHFCLLAMITDDTADTLDKNGNLKYDLKNSNNDTQKNVSIISQNEVSKGTSVYVRNISGTNKKYTLELIPRTTADNGIYSVAGIEMELSQPILAAWQRGGCNGTNISYAPAQNSRMVKFISKDSRLESIIMDGQEFDKVTLTFNFNSATIRPQTYTLDLIQRDEKGNIIGGETFIVERPHATIAPLQITSTEGEGNSVTLSSNAENDCNLRWENAEGFTISREATVTVNPYLGSEQTYHVYAVNDNGELGEGSITLNMQPEIETVSENNGHLLVKLTKEAPFNSTVVITSALTGEYIMSANIENGEREIIFDTNNLLPGLYIVTYSVDGNMIDSNKFKK